MAIIDDFSVANDGTGNIRYTGSGSTYYTVLEFKNYLGGLMDDAQASGDDLADITTDTIYVRSTDQILTLNSPFNIDDNRCAGSMYSGYQIRAPNRIIVATVNYPALNGVASRLSSSSLSGASPQAQRCVPHLIPQQDSDLVGRTS